MSTVFDVPTWARPHFPALSLQVNGNRAVFLDGPAGTQVPVEVADAVRQYLLSANANHGGVFWTSRKSDELVAAAHQAAADLLGAGDPATVIFGPNMTTLTFAISRAIARTWKPGDEVIVTDLDHDANITPWVRAAQDAGAVVKVMPVRPEDCTLDLDAFENLLSERTRLVAVGYASNAVGTLNPIDRICRAAHRVGAWCFVDAVHAAPHRRIDVGRLDCDFLVCSAYKFFGPHLGILWGRRELLEDLPAYKVRPAPEQLPDKWMTGTQPFELIEGMRAAVDYLAELGRTGEGKPHLDRRLALDAAYRAIEAHEQLLVRHLLERLEAIRPLRVWGITDRQRMQERVATVSVSHRRVPAVELAKELAAQGIFVWHGNFYALRLTELLNLEPHGMLRIGAVHYNTLEEIDRLADLLAHLTG
ncbi:MAG: cysteine desulfurase-like protein [Pirellulaceae bacterium]|nr:MAG: cysteine desulfurase-like protein [Pirellulaceae bacterium]